MIMVELIRTGRDAAYASAHGQTYKRGDLNRLNKGHANTGRIAPYRAVSTDSASAENNKH